MNTDILPNLFRTEYRKIIAVLCKRFGAANLETAEDIASETFVTASQVWGLEGVPVNPTAWLYKVAKNKAFNHLRRHQLFEQKIRPSLSGSEISFSEIDLSPEHIADSQLQVMFTLCHPAIPMESQIALCLRILCGFSVDEIASAFLTNRETINKRIVRAKEKLREAKIIVEVPSPDELQGRLSSVLMTIYLVFNEGYYSSMRNEVVRKELCLEAIRLCTVLIGFATTNTGQTNALMAIMCFHISRFDARLSDEGSPILYPDQDTSRWDGDWIARGGYFLGHARSDESISRFHLEAGIAYWNTQRNDSDGKWSGILRLYDHLLKVDSSPLLVLNRIYAVAQVHGKSQAIIEALAIPGTGGRFYPMLLGELYTGIDDEKAIIHFEEALTLARSSERGSIVKRLNKIKNRQL